MFISKKYINIENDKKNIFYKYVLNKNNNNYVCKNILFRF